MPLKVIDNETFAKIEAEASKVECNRCGLCCKLPSGKYCRNFRKRPDGLSYCAIYGKAGRIGSPIGEGQVCTKIMLVPTLFEGCP